MNSKKTFRYGGKSLAVLDQQNTYVPQFTSPIKLPKEFESALATAVLEDMPSLLIGETGTGKTSAVRELAFLRKQGYSRINMNGYTTPDELIGSKSVANGATYYEDGILTRAMKEGHIVVLDELNATPPDCTFIIHGLLDDDKRVTLPNGDIVRPHADFRVFATMNPDYEGTRSLNRAFLDRFAIILHFDIPTPIKEHDILVEKSGVVSELATKMVTIAAMARKAYQDQKTLTFLSTRGLMQWAQLIATGMDQKHAFVAAIANKARAEERTAFMDFYNAVFKVKPEDEADAVMLTTKKQIDGYETQLRDLREKNQTFSRKVLELEGEKSNWDSEIKRVKTENQKLADDMTRATTLLEKANKFVKVFDQIKEVAGVKEALGLDKVETVAVAEVVSEEPIAVIKADEVVGPQEEVDENGNPISNDGEHE